MKRKVKILGTGKYLPKKIMTSEELSKRIGVSVEWIVRHTGVKQRYYIEDETASFMAVQAIHEALKNANMTLKDIDCIVGASGTMEQHLPCNAAVIKHALGCDNMSIPAFDINATCLSFPVAFDNMSYFVDAGRYKHVLMVSSDIASIGLNLKNKESACLFGDGAAAVIIGKSTPNEGSGIFNAYFETYSQGVRMTEVPGVGTKSYSTRKSYEQLVEASLFRMDGKGIFKLYIKHDTAFFNKLFEPLDFSISDCAMVIPHQASGPGLNLAMKRLGVPKDKYMYILPNHGNMIAASTPLALHEAIVQGEIHRGDRIMICGTGAGLTLAGMVLEY